MFFLKFTQKIYLLGRERLVGNKIAFRWTLEKIKNICRISTCDCVNTHRCKDTLYIMNFFHFRTYLWEKLDKQMKSNFINIDKRDSMPKVNDELLLSY